MTKRLRQCTLGKILKSECHKTLFTPEQKLSFLSEHEPNKKFILLLRCNLTEASLQVCDTKPTICVYHEQLYYHQYSRNQVRCCNPYNLHKKRPLHKLKEISIDHALYLNRTLHTTIKPGQKLCPRCYKKLTTDYNPQIHAPINVIEAQFVAAHAAAQQVYEPPPTAPEEEPSDALQEASLSKRVSLRRPKKAKAASDAPVAADGAKGRALPSAVSIFDSSQNVRKPSQDADTSLELESITSDTENISSSDSAAPEIYPEVFLQACNEHLSQESFSPIVLHKLKVEDRQKVGRKKVTQLVTATGEKIVKKVARALNIPETKIQPSLSPQDIYSDEQFRSLADYQCFLNDLKLKLKCSNVNEKISLLTTAPASWSTEKVAREFEVTEYQVKRARKLKQDTKTILAKVPKKRGKTLPQSTVDEIIKFYEDDGFTKLCSGKKETISVKINNVRVKKQRRWILLNYKDLYLQFKKHNPNIIVGFSKFVELRPKWCVPITSKGSHNVCVCMFHQNLKLMIEKLGHKITHREIFDKLVCSRQSKQCMIQRCYSCPGVENLRKFLENLLKNEDGDVDEEIKFKQWTQGRSVNLEEKKITVVDFIELLCEKADETTAHHFVAKAQSDYLRNLKENLPADSAIVLFDFAENYNFPVQDSTQAYYFDKKQATLHPAVIYYHKQGEDTLTIKSACVISDERSHDAITVSAFTKKIIVPFREENLHIKKIVYFSDGAASQYKNCSNLRNLCYHFTDYSLTASWNFFATSHGKSPCDGIGAVAKRSATRASLRAQGSEGHILTPLDLYNHCKDNIKEITFYWCPSSEVAERAVELKERLSTVKTVPGSRSHHRFDPESLDIIRLYRMSDDDTFTRASVTHAPQQHEETVEIDSTDLKIGQYIACAIDNECRVGLIVEKADTDMEVQVRFTKKNVLQLSWPIIEEISWVPFPHILAVISVNASNKSVMNTMSISRNTNKLIQEKFKIFTERNS